MKPLALILPLLLACAAGCRSNPPHAEAPRRDYLSVNRGGLDSMGECLRESRELRRKNLRVSLEMKRREQENRAQRKEGLAFAGATLSADEGARARELWEAIRRNVREETTNNAVSRRFGFLDSGD
ncbi:MAG: hypothetical protein ACT4PV_04990 [Planctomycetaceae bacterium]